jgi:hypothetical protein
MPSEKVLRPNVCTIEADTAVAEVERSEGEARTRAHQGNHKQAAADVREAR